MLGVWYRPGWKKEQKQKKFPLDSDDFGFICAGVSNVVSCKRNVGGQKTKTKTPAIIWVVCYITTTKENLFVRWPFSETYGVINYGSGWRNDDVNQWLESG